MRAKSKKMMCTTRPVIFWGPTKPSKWTRNKNWVSSSRTRSLRPLAGRRSLKNYATGSWIRAYTAARRTMQHITTFRSRHSGARGRKATLVKYSNQSSTSVKRQSPTITQSFAGRSTRLATVRGATPASTFMTARTMRPEHSRRSSMRLP